mmetsp:Transcript_1368/g.1529  ORF Transcript_1368/g.1529 Transcript_1368/m.1529 type:complete len:100 (+) Transcript_1368:611-910(+)
MGSAISNYIGSMMMKSIMKETSIYSGPSKQAESTSLTYCGKEIPADVFTKPFTFASLLCQPKSSIQPLDKQTPGSPKSPEKEDAKAMAPYTLPWPTQPF